MIGRHEHLAQMFVVNQFLAQSNGMVERVIFSNTNSYTVRK